VRNADFLSNVLANTAVAVAVFRTNNFGQLEWVAVHTDLTAIGGLERVEQRYRPLSIVQENSSSETQVVVNNAAWYRSQNIVC
jgi:hypothetical protein